MRIEDSLMFDQIRSELQKNNRFVDTKNDIVKIPYTYKNKDGKTINFTMIIGPLEFINLSNECIDQWARNTITSHIITEEAKQKPTEQ